MDILKVINKEFLELSKDYPCPAGAKHIFVTDCDNNFYCHHCISGKKEDDSHLTKITVSSSFAKGRTAQELKDSLSFPNKANIKIEVK